jgi:DNA mismatch endonuclease, patch repair protein
MLESPQKHAPVSGDAATRSRMVAQRRRDTNCEMAIRRLLHRKGLRYRVDYAATSQPRVRADIVFPKARIVVFVDGCFWHGCSTHRSVPRRNRSWWQKKIEYNQQRDERSNQLHEREGWKVFRFWEHDRPEDVATLLIAAIAERGVLIKAGATTGGGLRS